MSLYQLDEQTPFLTYNSIPIQWTNGPDALKVAQSSVVRINERGVQFYRDHWTIRDLSANGWKSFDCFPAPGMLCKHQDGNVFSFLENPVIQINRFQEFLCTGKVTNQIMNSSTNKYDLSSCNVFTSGYDFVYYQNRLYYYYTGMQWWEYMLLSVITIYSIRTFSNIVVDKIGSNDGFIYVIFCIIGIIFICGQNGANGFVSYEDVCAFWFVIFYLVFDISIFFLDFFFHWFHWFPTYNIVITAFTLISIRLYHGIISPYVPFLIWAVVSRCYLKLISYEWSVLSSLNLFMDSLLISFLSTFGCTLDVSTILCIVFVAIITADVIFRKKQSQSELKRKEFNDLQIVK